MGSTCAVPAGAADAGDTPSLVYFTADWCVTCRVIERSVFPDPTVVNALDGTCIASTPKMAVTASNAAEMARLN